MLPPEVESVRFSTLASEQDLLRARQLHGQVYVDCGYVEDLAEWGVIDDEFVPRSRYWGGIDTDGDVAGVVRQISSGAELDLPAATRVPLYPEGEEYLRRLDPRRVVEISALAVDRSRWAQAFAISAGLYRAMYQDFIVNRDHTHWLAVMDDYLLPILEGPFHFPFTHLGPPIRYMGGNCRAVALDLSETFHVVYQADADLRTYFLSGLNVDVWHDLAPQDVSVR